MILQCINLSNRCRLFFHLEDDSLALVEPGQKNSGMVQGRLVRRHSVPFNPLPEQDEGPRHLDTPHINMWDLNVGRELKVYGKMVRPVACDAFTRHFLSCNGVDVGTEEPVPQDSHEESRTKMEARRPLRPYKKLNSNAGQFLENDGKVLRFYGIWEDGLDKRNLVLLYFLADDTIQIAEKHPESGGRYPAPTFLKRTKVPKDPDLLVNIPGSLSEQTLLNVVTTPGTGRRKKHHMLADNRDLSSRLVQYYDAADLKLGMEISICGKKILLHDCDQFTRDYYKVKFGIDGMVAVDVSPPLPRPTVKQVPPYTGLGTEEDSLTSWLGGNSLEPKPPTRDFFKFHALDRKGYDSHVLRFSARLLKENTVDRTRRLVLAFYLSDDSIQGWVIGEPGTGVTSGPFLERGKAKRPKTEQPEDPALPSNYYSAQDLHVGGILDIGGHTILLTEADEYVFDFMEREEQREKFPQSNLRVILDKVGAKLRGELKALMARFMREDPTDSGTVTEATYRQVLDSVLGPELSEHETTTLLRRYREAGAESLNEERTRLISLIQADLRRDNFSQFDKLLLACRQEDPSETGKLGRSVIRRILLSSLGLSRSQARTQAVRHLLDSFLATEEEQVGAELGYPSDSSLTS